MACDKLPVYHTYSPLTKWPQVRQLFPDSYHQKASWRQSGSKLPVWESCFLMRLVIADTIGARSQDRFVSWHNWSSPYHDTIYWSTKKYNNYYEDHYRYWQAPCGGSRQKQRRCTFQELCAPDTPFLESIHQFCCCCNSLEIVPALVSSWC